MKRFVRKKVRAMSKVKFKPKKLGIISVFAFVVFTFSMIHAFATNDVTFTLTPKRASAIYTRGENADMVLKFDTNKNWDRVGFTVEYDPDVFQTVSKRATPLVAKYDGTPFDDEEDDPYLPDQQVYFQSTSGGGSGNERFSYSALFSQSGVYYSEGLTVGELRFKIKSDAPSGQTTIHILETYQGAEQTFLGLGSDRYTYSAQDVVITIDVPVQSHDIDKSQVDLDINKKTTDTIGVTFFPLDTTTPSNISYTPVNCNNIATVSNDGLVTAVGPGSCSITVSEFGTTHSVPVNVTAELVGITLNQSLVEIGKQQSYPFTVTNNPNPTTDTVTYTWESANTGIATVDPSTGIVTGVLGGQTTITATAVINGTPSTTIKATATVKVVVPFTSATATNSPMNLRRGIEGESTGQIEVEYLPQDATQEKVASWSSADTGVATVSSTGLVTAVGSGTTTITGTVAGLQTPITVTVNVSVPMLTFTASPTETSLYTGQTTSITTAYSPLDTDENKVVAWSTSNQNVATVSGGTVTAEGPGTATITAASGNSNLKTATTTVHVYDAISSATMSQSTATLYTNNGAANQTVTLSVSVSPSGAGTPADNVVSWTSSDQGVATVANGVVTAVANGTTTITATLGSGAQDICTVTVKTKVTSFTVSNETSLTMENGSTHTIETTILPENASDKTIAWDTGNGSVATVSAAGEITATGNGDTIITGEADGQQVTVNVHVVTSATSVTITEGDSIDINKGSSLTLHATAAPAGTSDTITWSSGKPSAVSVNSTTGEITGILAEDVVITATAGSKTDTITVHVKSPASGIAINQGSTMTLNQGSSTTLTTTVTPNDCTDTVTWSSDNGHVTVDQDGHITAVSVGNSTVTATVGTGSNIFTDSIDIEVIVAATAVDIDQGEEAYVQKDGTTTLTATITPSGSTQGITWTSNNTSKATVDPTTGVVTGVATGDAVITATVGSVHDSITIHVVISATSVSINQTGPININKDETTTLTATRQPTGTTDNVVWSSSNTSIATVDPTTGVVTGVARGSAVITARAGSQTDTITINVLVPATSITLNKTGTVNINKDSTDQLSATILPSDTTDTTITWTSSSPSVASVSNSGLVTANTVGTTTITARVGTNVTASVTYSVKSPATSVTIDQTGPININKNSTTTLTATRQPTGTTDNVVWSSSNTSIATVDPSTGVVTGKAKGSAVITATAGSQTDTITINVLVPATSISLNKTGTVNINKESTDQLYATISPSDTTDTTITWTSSSPSVASVSNSGLVTANTVGTTTITARVGTNVTASVTYSVKSPATSITINGADSITVPRNTTTGLSATILPSDTTDTTITWTSSNTSVATVSSSGLVTGVAKGTATITAKVGNNKTDTVTVTVNAPITNFTTSTPNVSVIKGRTAELTYTITPSDTTDSTDITWHSNNTNIVTVEDGTITGVAAGSTTVTATVGGRTITYNISVGIIPITNITLSQTNFELRKGSDQTLTYTITPSDTTEITDPTWTSSNTSIATVDSNGKVTGIAAGEATITMTMGDKSGTATVTVIEVPLTSITIANSEGNVAIGESLTLHVQENPDDTTDEITYTFTSSDDNIATVDNNGNVTGIKDGTVRITVHASNGLEDTIELNVVIPDIINPNTGVLSIIVFTILGFVVLFGIGSIAYRKNSYA